MTTPATPSDAALPPGPAGGTQPPSAATDLGPATVTIASYPDYRSAQLAVDYLSDNGFPVEHTAIVGTGLRLVENVLGRLTVWRATLGGAASGAWFGLFIGLLLGIFVANASWVGVVLSGLLIGAAWGAIFGGTAHAMTRGQRDFTSRSSLQAEQYGVVVDVDVADQARQLLVRFNWNASNAS